MESVLRDLAGYDIDFMSFRTGNFFREPVIGTMQQAAGIHSQVTDIVALH